jgi:hypothetical protein
MVHGDTIPLLYALLWIPCNENDGVSARFINTRVMPKTKENERSLKRDEQSGFGLQ